MTPLAERLQQWRARLQIVTPGRRGGGENLTRTLTLARVPVRLGIWREIELDIAQEMVELLMMDEDKSTVYSTHEACNESKFNRWILI